MANPNTTCLGPGIFTTPMGRQIWQTHYGVSVWEMVIYMWLGHGVPISDLCLTHGVLVYHLDIIWQVLEEENRVRSGSVRQMGDESPYTTELGELRASGPGANVGQARSLHMVDYLDSSGVTPHPSYDENSTQSGSSRTGWHPPQSHLQNEGATGALGPVELQLPKIY